MRPAPCLSSGSTLTLTGNRPRTPDSGRTSSGRSDVTCCSSSAAVVPGRAACPRWRKAHAAVLHAPRRQSRPNRNAPPQMKGMCASRGECYSWVGCLRPPCGGTLTTLPSMILSRPCCNTSRDVTRDRWVVAPACARSVDLVDVDDAICSRSTSIVRRAASPPTRSRLLAHVACLGQFVASAM